MLVEFQLSWAPLASMIRNKIQSLGVSFPGTFAFQGQTCLVDRIEFQYPSLSDEDGVLFSIMQGPLASAPVTGRKAQIKLPLVPIIKTLDAVIAAGASEAKTFANPTMMLVFDAGVSVLGGIPNFSLSLATVELPKTGDPAAEAKLRSQIMSAASAVLPFNVPLDLSMLSKVVPGPLVVQNAGVSANWDDTTGVDRIAVRLETSYADAGSVSAWSDFLNGRFTDRLLGRDWAIFVDKESLQSGIAETFRANLAGSSSFSLDDGPNVSWNAGTLAGDAESNARLSVTFSGAVKDACSYGSLKMDIDAHVTADVEMRVAKANVLGTDLQFDWDLSDSDVVFCSLAATFSGAVIGSIIGGVSAGPVGAVVGAIIGAVVVFVSVVVVATVKGPSEPLPLAGCKPVGDSVTHYICEQPVAIPPMLGGRLDVTRAYGAPDGLIIAGTMAVRDLRPARLKIPEVMPFEWRLSGICTSGGVVVSGSVELYNDGDIPLRFAETPAPIEDPLSNYSLSPGSPLFLSTIRPGELFLITLREAFMKDFSGLPAAERYPLKVWFRTSGGVRYLQLPSADRLSAEKSDELKKLKAALQGACNIPIRKLTDAIPKPVIPVWGEIGDGAWGHDSRVHVWQVTLLGVPAGDRITLTDLQGRTLSSADAGPTGFVQLSATVPPADNGQEIQIVRQPARRGARAAANAAPELRVKQLLLSEATSWELPVEATDILSQPYAGRPAVWVAADDGLRVYDVSSAQAASLRLWLPMEGTRAVGRWKGRTYVGGWRGLFEVSVDGRSLRPVDPAPVLGIAEAQGVLLTLGPAGVRAWSGQTLWTQSVRSGEHLLAGDGWYAVSTPRQVELYRLSPQRSVSAGRLPVRHARGLSLPSGTNGRTMLAIETNQGNALVYEVAGNRPRLAGEYYRTPWFVRSLRWRDAVAQLSADGRSMTLWVMRSVEKEPLDVAGEPRPAQAPLERPARRPIERPLPPRRPR